MSGEPGRSTPFPYGADSQEEADAIGRAQAAGLQALRVPMWEDQRSIEHFGNWTPYDPLDPDQACQMCLTPYTTDEPESEHQCGWEWIQP